MRNAIIGFLFFWIILSLGLLIFLTVKVCSLQSQIDKITKTNDSVSYDTNDEINYGATAYATDDEDNIAGLEDTLKVYLTFDDGPSENTDKILDILDDYGVKATFFVQGKTDSKSKDRMKRIVDEGHTIGMHTYSHSYGRIYESLESFSEDVTKIGNLIYDATGVDTIFYRFPGGSSNTIAGSKIGDYISYLNDNDIVYVDWNVASGDAASPELSVDAIVENVMSDVVRYKTSIVLLHDSDTKGNTLKALPILIEKLRGADAVILPIDSETSLIQHVTLDH